MTHHYSIEIIETKTYLKATYRDKKFRKLEHLRGVLNKNMMLQIGRIVPRHESDFPEFNKRHEGKVNFSIITQEKTIYTQFSDEWFSFYEGYRELPPKFMAADGKALKAIISYLTKVSTSEQEALELWKVILDKWDTLNDFHKANTDLKYINSKLNIIINAIKQQNNTNAKGTHGTVEL